MTYSRILEVLSEPAHVKTSWREDPHLAAVGDVDAFYKNAQPGEVLNLKFRHDGSSAPLEVIERLYENYGLLNLEDSKLEGMDMDVTPLSIVSVAGLLFVGWNADSPAEWSEKFLNEDDLVEFLIPTEFSPITEYSVDKESRVLKCTSYSSMRDAECKSVDALSPVSRLGGWPVDSEGKRLTDWPHVGDFPLIFRGQYRVPDGRIVWAFADAVEDVLTVLPQERMPEWDYYNPEWSGAQNYHWLDSRFKLELWHYRNREHVGKTIPYLATGKDNDDNRFAHGLSGQSTVAIVEDGEIPEWVTMKEVDPRFGSFVTSSEEAKAFPEKYCRAPMWLQKEPSPKEQYENGDCHSYLFQIDDGVGVIDFGFVNSGSLYVFWDGNIFLANNRARATMQS